MVSIGTLIGIRIAGAVGIGGYVLYLNRDKLGTIVSGAVQKSFVDPVSGWFDSLAQSFAGNNSLDTNTEQQQLRQQQYDLLKQQNELARQQQQQYYQQQYGSVISGYQDLLRVHQQQLQMMQQEGSDSVAPPLPPDFPGEEHRAANPEQPANEPLFAPSPGGYYFHDRPGSERDRQIKLKEGTADTLRRRGYDLYFLGLNKLSAAGLATFSASKNLGV